MSNRTSYDKCAHLILTEIEAGGHVSQRSLSNRLGIALGLTNLLVCRLVQKGFVRVVGVKPRRIRYLLTPAGIAEKARMAQEAFYASAQRYRLARDRILKAFQAISVRWPINSPSKPVMFFGVSELAEIGYVCLQETDLELIAVIDDGGRSRFFGVPVVARNAFSFDALSGARDARVIVMSVAPEAEVRREIEQLGILPERTFWP